jgi:hypothetical protein
VASNGTGGKRTSSAARRARSSRTPSAAQRAATASPAPITATPGVGQSAEDGSPGASRLPIFHPMENSCAGHSAATRLPSSSRPVNRAPAPWRGRFGRSPNEVVEEARALLYNARLPKRRRRMRKPGGISPLARTVRLGARPVYPHTHTWAGAASQYDRHATPHT